MPYSAALRPLVGKECAWCDQRLISAARGHCGAHYPLPGPCWWVEAIREHGAAGALRPSRERQKVRDALLRSGLIVELPRKTVGRDRFGAITLPQYDMPTSVHMQWCDAMAAECPDDA